MNTALRYGQTVSAHYLDASAIYFLCVYVTSLQALHVQPSDKAVVYNIAMIQQKAAEMLFAIKPSKRSLKDLQRAIDQAGHAQK